MLFTSPEFVIFLPVVFALYWIAPHKYRWAFLLAASCFFYLCAGVQGFLILSGVTVVTYASAIAMENKPEWKKTILTLTVVFCAGILALFKYLDFFYGIAEGIAGFFSFSLQPLTVKLILPLGISFFTFQVIGYLTDVYRGAVRAEHHLGYYALFTSYFPQILSGPIPRARQLLPQFRKVQIFSYDQAVYGMKLMMWGVFKKTVIADNLAVRIDLVYNNLTAASGGGIAFAVLLYSFQIYCDFSGYTDIARGVSKLLGIELSENFSVPYCASSFREFWRRWHISLSTWFRDYLYIPLGGNRCGKLRQYMNLMVTFLVSGLWHGADWTFILWGAVHGAFQVIEDFLKIRMPKVIGTVVVFAAVTLAWVLFRAATFDDAVYVFAHMFDGIGSFRYYVRYAILDLGFISVFDFVWHMAVYLIPLLAFDAFSLKTDVIAWTATLPALVRHSLYALLIAGICLLHSYGEVSFVYFQF